MNILESPIVSRITWFILRPVGAFFIGKPYHLRKVDFQGLEGLTPPFLILPNHATILDSALLGLHSRKVIRYVAADGNFRTGLQAAAFRMLGAVPKAKGVSEIDLIRTLMKIKNKGGIIGIFPEGQSSWDGTTLPLILATAKLVKLFKVPAVLPVLRGGYLCHPRWSFKRRASGMEISYREIFSREMIKSLSAEELFAHMERALEWDDHQWLKEKGTLKFRKKFRAEGIERLLFVCPSCESIGTLRSKNNRFSCTHCRLTVHVNDRGLFESENLPPSLTQERDWNLWQNQWLKDYINALSREKDIFSDSPVNLYEGYKAKRMRKIDTGTLRLNRSGGIAFSAEQELEFPIEEITALNVFKQDLLEFYHNNKLYRAFFPTRKVSAYKWMQAVKLLQTESGKK